MARHRQSVCLLLVVFIMSLVLLGPAEPNNVAAAGKKLQISMATGSPTGGFYTLGAVIADLLNQKLGDVVVTPEVTAASIENARLLESGDCLIGMLTSTVCYGYNENKQLVRVNFPKIRSLMMMSYSDMSAVTLQNSRIRSFRDMAGKKISVGAPGSVTEVGARHVLELYGMTYKDIKPEFLSFAESMDALKDGRIDAAFFSITGRPAAALMDISTTKDICILSFEDSKADEFVEKCGYAVKRTLPPGLYRGVDKPVTVLSPFNVFVASVDLPDDLAYRVTRTVWESLKTLQKAHPAFAEFELSKAAERLFPLHPGAKKYYNEMGVK